MCENWQVDKRYVTNSIRQAAGVAGLLSSGGLLNAQPLQMIPTNRNNFPSI